MVDVGRALPETALRCQAHPSRAGAVCGGSRHREWETRREIQEDADGGGEGHPRQQGHGNRGSLVRGAPTHKLDFERVLQRQISIPASLAAQAQDANTKPHR